MAESNSNLSEEAFLDEIDAFVDECISAMSSAEFKTFKKKSKETMAEIRRYANDSFAPCKTIRPESPSAKALDSSRLP
jgi:hypothetical protein